MRLKTLALMAMVAATTSAAAMAETEDTIGSVTDEKAVFMQARPPKHFSNQLGKPDDKDPGKGYLEAIYERLEKFSNSNATDPIWGKGNTWKDMSIRGEIAVDYDEAKCYLELKLGDCRDKFQVGNHADGTCKQLSGSAVGGKSCNTMVFFPYEGGTYALQNPNGKNESETELGFIYLAHGSGTTAQFEINAQTEYTNSGGFWFNRQSLTRMTLGGEWAKKPKKQTDKKKNGDDD